MFWPNTQHQLLSRTPPRAHMLHSCAWTQRKAGAIRLAQFKHVFFLYWLNQVDGHVARSHTQHISRPDGMGPCRSTVQTEATVRGPHSKTSSSMSSIKDTRDDSTGLCAAAKHTVCTHTPGCRLLCNSGVPASKPHPCHPHLHQATASCVGVGSHFVLVGRSPSCSML
jgi:hypothetical protein